jgi:hypothetical protein
MTSLWCPMVTVLLLANMTGDCGVPQIHEGIRSNMLCMFVSFRGYLHALWFLDQSEFWGELERHLPASCCTSWSFFASCLWLETSLSACTKYFSWCCKPIAQIHHQVPKRLHIWQQQQLASNFNWQETAVCPTPSLPGNELPVYSTYKVRT